MKLTVLYFAALADVTKQSREELHVATAPMTVGELAQHLCVKYTGLSDCLNYVRFACNEEFVSFEHKLADGDTVALLPPVAGG